MKNVIVTGGGGFIGSHVCKALSLSGYTPITIDNFSTGNRWAVKFGPLEEVDIHDEKSISEILLSYKPVGVIHLAASAYIGESVSNPAKYWQNNVAGSLSLFQAVLAYGRIPTVFSSTCAVYGIQSSFPMTEEMSLSPVNPYGRSKLVVERILLDFDSAYGFPHVCLRYFNAAGAAEDGSIGEVHVPEPHLIPNAINAALGGGVLTVFGTDYPTPDGTAIRDYIHVSDLAQAHLLALAHLLEGGASEAFNLGNGAGYSVLEVVKAVENASRLVVPVKFEVRRAGDPPCLIGSSAKIERIFGWKPQFGLKEMVAHAVSWHCNRM